MDASSCKQTCFDKVADDFACAAFAIPHEYFKCIEKFARLQPRMRLLELGCGAGDLAIRFANTNYDVTALDSSRVLIGIARQKDASKKVRWVHADVSEVDLHSESYDLIFSFESFHLFPAHRRLVKRLANALVAGGTLAIGWCDYHWEKPFEEAIRREFHLLGVEWGEWGYQRTPSFAEAVQMSSGVLGPMCSVSLQVYETVNTVDIAAYLSSINKSASLSAKTRNLLRTRLTHRLSDLVGGSTCNGLSTYHICGAVANSRVV
jgi:SAM-dependent methyltransferase